MNDRQRHAIRISTQLRAIVESWIAHAYAGGKDPDWARDGAWGQCSLEDLCSRSKFDSVFDPRWRKWQVMSAQERLEAEAKALYAAPILSPAAVQRREWRQEAEEIERRRAQETRAAAPGPDHAEPVGTDTCNPAGAVEGGLLAIGNGRDGAPEGVADATDAADTDAVEFNDHALLWHGLADYRAGGLTVDWDIKLWRNGLAPNASTMRSLVDKLELCLNVLLTFGKTEWMLSASAVCRLMGWDPTEGNLARARTAKRRLLDAGVMRWDHDREPIKGRANGTPCYEPYLAALPGVQVTLEQIVSGEVPLESVEGRQVQAVGVELPGAAQPAHVRVEPQPDAEVRN